MTAVRTGLRSDSTGCHAWIEGREVTCAEFREWLRWQQMEPIWDEVSAGRCTNCHATDCHCCHGCGQPDADIIGNHGYHCCL